MQINNRKYYEKNFFNCFFKKNLVSKKKVCNFAPLFERKEIR